MKSLDEQVEEFKMPFGKWKGCLLEDIDKNYLEWYLGQDDISRWHKKLIERYMDTNYQEEINDGCEYHDIDEENIPF